MADDAPASKIIQPPKLKEAVIQNSGRRCDQCDNGYFPTPESHQGMCRLDPPKVFGILIPPTMVGGAPRDVNLSMQPIVTRDQSCRSGFESKPRDKAGMN